MLVPDLLSTSPTITYSGSMHTDYAIDEDNEAGTISFHMEDLDITSLSGAVSSGSKIFFTEVMFDFQTTIVKLVANESFPSGGGLNTDVGFKAELEPSLRQGRGLYKVPCTEGSDKYCWFTQFEPSGARMAFPCRDDPDAKAVFNVAVARTEGWNTLANGPLFESVPMDGMDGWFMESFSGGPPMSTYLVALAIQDFASVEGPDNVTTVWATKDEIDQGLGDYSAVLGAQVLDFYGSTFAFEYNKSLPKMDMVSVPNKGGAMENWGLVLYSKATLMFDQEENDEEKHWRVLEVVAHELAHQWTGNLVTMKWWDQTWLNEGFASYISHLGAEALDPLGAAQSWARLLVHRTHSVMRDDAGPDSWALSDAVTSRTDVGRKFGSITYSKGASVIRMMESILGRTTLIHGLTIYFGNLQYGSAVEEDLFRDLEAAAILDGKYPQDGVDNFEKTMKTWTNQAGLPLVTVTRDGNTILLEQTWYTEGEGGQRLWDIPLTGGFEGYWGEVVPSDIFWFTDKQASLNLNPDVADIDLIFFNKLGMGYYR